MKLSEIDPSLPIGMFDSGFGGLTVLQQVMRVLPNESVIYLADTAHLPYGDKSRETIIRYAIENVIFLMDQGIKMLVIPCNTVASNAMEKLRRIFNIPIIGVIEPGAEKAVAVTNNQRIGVIGTQATIRSGIYQREIQSRLSQAVVCSLACPLFVPLVEEGMVSHPATRLIVKEYLTPLHQENIDTLLLSCTHYPLISHLLKDEMGERVSIVDSATTCAEKVQQFLIHNHLTAKEQVSPQYRYFASDHPEKFQSLGQQLLGIPLSYVSKVP